jgi:hypothetical protein
MALTVKQRGVLKGIIAGAGITSGQTPSSRSGWDYPLVCSHDTGFSLRRILTAADFRVARKPRAFCNQQRQSTRRRACAALCWT